MPCCVEIIISLIIRFDVSYVTFRKVWELYNLVITLTTPCLLTRNPILLNGRIMEWRNLQKRLTTYQKA